MTRKYASFTKEFKLEALKLAESSDISIAQLARNLGIRRNMIYKWQKQMTNKKEDAFKRTVSQSKSHENVDSMADLIAENQRLKKALKRSEMEKEILKKRKLTSGTKSPEIQIHKA